MQELSIWMNSAPISDPAAVSKILEQIPNAPAELLEGDVGNYTSFEPPGTAYFVMSDHTTVTRFTVRELSEPEARAISKEFDAWVFWTADEFEEMVKLVLHGLGFVISANSGPPS